MKKRKIATFALLVFSIVMCVGLIYAEETVCCEQTNNGLWCQNDIFQSDCSGSAASTSCDQTSFCQLGTCISAEGICMPNTPNARCEAEGGTFNIEPLEDIPLCQYGCCIMGESTTYVTQTECRQLATDYGINTSFDREITDEGECLLMNLGNQRGACVTETETETLCTMNTQETCLANSDNEFYPGILCTSPDLHTNCAKTNKKTCGEDGRIYYLDSCNNIANVYDSTLYGDQDYWIHIQDTDCIAQGNSGSCGNCDYLDGTICSSDGGYVCKSLDCTDLTSLGVRDFKEEFDRTPKHGESWCAESEGTYPHIRVDPITGELVTNRSLLENESAYNLPGSEYYKLICYNGEVTIEPCAPQRNEVCVESTILETNFNQAKCQINNWRNCNSLNTKTDCEDAGFFDCKWIPGYRFDATIVSEDLREEQQGSCVPLFAPGFDFWSSTNASTENTNDAMALCALGTVAEAALFETNWVVDREDFAGWSAETQAGGCLDSCYSIPGYGEGLSLDQLNTIYTGGSVGTAIADLFVSQRRGHYCAKRNDPDQWLNGMVTGEEVGCADDERRRDFPLFFRNSDWISSMTSRTKSLGDCGYKMSASGEMGQADSEIITAIFQKLKQSGDVKENITDIETIYRGDKYVFED